MQDSENLVGNCNPQSQRTPTLTLYLIELLYDLLVWVRLGWGLGRLPLRRELALLLHAGRGDGDRT